MDSQNVIPDLKGETALPTINEEFRKNTGRISGVELSVETLNALFANGILKVLAGGTGQDFSAAAANTLAYFSALGVMSLTASSGGDVTKFLRGDFAFAAVPQYFSLASTTNLAAATNSGEISINSAKSYLVRVVLTGMSSGDNLGLRFNADSTLNNYAYASSGTLTFDKTEIRIGSSFATTEKNTYIDIYIQPQGTTSGKYIYINGKSWGIDSGSTHTLADFWAGWTKSETVTSLSIYPVSGGGVTMTGNVYLYEIALQ